MKLANYVQIFIILYQRRYNYQLMSIKILLSVAILTLAALTINNLQNITNINDIDFQMFKTRFRKNYKPEQENFRKHIYMINKAKIQEHNTKTNRTYEQQINQFADLTLQQFKEIYLGLKINQQRINTQVHQPKVGLELDIDWRAQAKVTRVKNQGMCASCWAFCTVAALESAYLIKGVNQQFSQQQLVDCSNTYGNLGCHGGELQYAYHYIKDKGINTQVSYPYTAKDQNCKKTHGPFKMAGYSRALTCSGLYTALQKGPVSVAVDALFWGFYKDGIYNDCGNEVNHGVLVVGSTQQYWLIKNSWGVQWGNNGYIKLQRGNTCSVCEYPYYPEL